MTERNCVVTGGAGFIGCALSAGLVERFRRVIVLDNLHPQIHSEPLRPPTLHYSADFHRADITEPQVWEDLLAVVRPDVIVHLAAETGTGQSLTETSRHAHLNVYGTAVMLDALSRHGQAPGHIVLTSSRAVYGEGCWRRSDGGTFYPGKRNRDQLAGGTWDFAGAKPVPFSVASTEPRPTSVYGATKLAQEHILAAWATAFGSTLTIARLQNVYGPGQSLINAYTGVVSRFAQLAREKQSIPLYEDGLMQRDYVYIDDVVSALLAGIDRGVTEPMLIDIGSGRTATIQQVAEFMASRYGAPQPHLSGAYRHGDVRHAGCDIVPTLRRLDWIPRWPLEEGLEALCNWIDTSSTSGVSSIPP